MARDISQSSAVVGVEPVTRSAAARLERDSAFPDTPVTRPTRTRVTLIIPAHNEEHRLPSTLRRYATALKGRFGDQAELIVVANGCSDRTVGVAAAMQAEFPFVRVIDIPDAIGKGAAILEGFRRASGVDVLFADADGATDVRSLFALLDDLATTDVVAGSRHVPGSRITRRQPLRRRVLSRAFNFVVRTLFRLDIHDTQCGAKALRGDAAGRLAHLVGESGWTFDLDLLLTARRLGLSIVERPVLWGDVSGSQLRVPTTSLAVVGSLWRLWRRERSATVVHARQRRILALNWRCTKHPEAGGAELNLFEQARRWQRDGHDVTVVAARHANGQTLPASEILDGVRVLRMGGRFGVYLRAAWYLTWHGSEYDEILDVSNGIPFFTPLFTPRSSALLVHHVHDRQWFTEFRQPMSSVGWFLERYVVPLVYRRRPVIAVSPTTRDALIRTGFAPERISVIYNGVTAFETATAAIESAQVHDGAAIAPSICYVGRLKRYKRLGLLIDAYAALSPSVPGLRLDIVGDGDARASLEAHAAELGVSDGVKFHGFVDEPTKAAILATATVFATPSMHEGWGLSVIEANLHGCPAVAYDVPGLSAAIVDGRTGFLASDDAGFRDALARILLDRAVRERLSAGAREWAARFDWEATAAATLRLLDVFAISRRVDLSRTAA